MEETQFQAGIHLWTCSHAQAFDEYAIAQLKDWSFVQVISCTVAFVCQSHTIFRRGDSQGVAGIAVVAYADYTCQGEVGAQFHGSSSFYTTVAAVDTCNRLVNKGACFIIVVTIELGAIPELGEESCHTTTNDRVVE